MADLSHTDTFDDWLLSDTGASLSNSQPLSTSLPPSPVFSTNEASFPSSDLPTVFPGDQPSNEKKRKGVEQTTDQTEQKKSKQVPPYMRRNIRHLFTDDKLQVDTLTALQAEQERLKRLEDINTGYHQYKTFFTHQSANSYPQAKARSAEEECIVLDDEDGDSSESQSFLKHKFHSGKKKSPVARFRSVMDSHSHWNTFADTSKGTADDDDDDDDGNDSDIQCVDSDSESVNDLLTKKLQRLHVDDRVNVPDGNGKRCSSTSLSSNRYGLPRQYSHQYQSSDWRTRSIFMQAFISYSETSPDRRHSLHVRQYCRVSQTISNRSWSWLYPRTFDGLWKNDPGTTSIDRKRSLHSTSSLVQVIAFIDVFLRYAIAKSVLIVVPINTIQNWVNEFNRWCPIADSTLEYTRPYQFYLLNDASKKFEQRTSIVQNWSKTGGVLIIGYEMFRLLATKKIMPTKSSHSNRAGNHTSPGTPTFRDLEDEGRNLNTVEGKRTTVSWTVVSLYLD